jgi:hypothetical protein
LVVATVELDILRGNHDPSMSIQQQYNVGQFLTCPVLILLSFDRVQTSIIVTS